jgi:hypothetical protein
MVQVNSPSESSNRWNAVCSSMVPDLLALPAITLSMHFRSTQHIAEWPDLLTSDIVALIKTAPSVECGMAQR